MMKQISGLVAVLALGLTACATAPKTTEEKANLRAQAQASLEEMVAQDPTLEPLLEEAYGYVVFPSVGKGGALVGGAYGRGIVYEQGQPVGFAELNQASLGAQLGGQTFSELIVFQNQAALERLKRGQYSVGAEASAVALNRGAARTARFDGGVAVFVVPRGGLMAELSVSGQRINYQPAG